MQPNLFTIVFQSPDDVVVGFIKGAGNVAGAILGVEGATRATIMPTQAGDDARDPLEVLRRGQHKLTASAVSGGWRLMYNDETVPAWAAEIIYGLDLGEREIRAGRRAALAAAALAADKARERARGLDTHHQRDAALYTLAERVRVAA